MAKLYVEWLNASDDTGIAGYELSYKEDVSPEWIIEPFIATSNTFGNYILTGLTPCSGYEIRVRTKDIDGLWSVDYAEITKYLPCGTTIKRITTGVEEMSNNFLCSFLTPTINIYILVPSGSLTVNDLVFSDSNHENRFNGNDLWWRINNGRTYKISTQGVILAELNCLGISYYRNEGINPLDIPNCNDMTLDIIPVYTNVTLFELAVGDFLFNNSALTSPLVGNNLAYTVGATQYDTVTFRVDNNGMITEILQVCTNV